MNLDQQPDGWHLRSDEGLDIGPFESLTAASDYLDLMENRRRTQVDVGLLPEPSRTADSMPGFWRRLGGSISRGLGLGHTESEPRPRRTNQRWTVSSGR